MHVEEQNREAGRFAGLLATIALMLGVLTWASETGRSGVFVGLATSLMLMGAVYAVSRRRTHVWVGLSVAIPALATHWLWELYETRLLLSLNLGLMIVFLSLTTWFVVDTVRTRSTVDLDTVLGGVCAYILMVIVFMYIHGLLAVTVPGSYLVLGSEVGDLSRQGLFVEFFYFSVVTLTTLGYGDIVPIRSGARMVCGLQAIFGQLFVAIVIARLVSLYTVSARPQGDS
jgi:hypothetical protein